MKPLPLLLLLLRFVDACGIAIVRLALSVLCNRHVQHAASMGNLCLTLSSPPVATG